MAVTDSDIISTSRATMKDVAALAKVSLKTVSRVVNGEESVNLDMTLRVKDAIRKLGYQQHYGASALRRSDNRSSQIALLLEDIANPFSGAIFNAVEAEAVARGYIVLVAGLKEQPERERELVQIMIRHRVDGFIIAPSSTDHSYLVKEQESGVPFVFIDRPPVGLIADTVLSQSQEGSRTATLQLLQNGHTRIAYLGDLSTIRTAQERLGGFMSAHAEMNVAPVEEFIVKDIRTSEQAALETERLMDMELPPTAVFAGQNLLTMGAVRALQGRGLQHRVAVIGIDDFIMADLLDPGVSVIAQRPASIGTVAANMLFDRLEGLRAEVESTTIPVDLLQRGSGEIRPS